MRFWFYHGTANQRNYGRRANDQVSDHEEIRVWVAVALRRDLHRVAVAMLIAVYETELRFALSERTNF